MSHNVFKQCGLLGVALAGLLALNTQGAVLECAAITADKVTNTSACQYSDTATQDFLSDPMTVNTEEFFGADDWSFLDKNDGITSSSGTWSVDSSYWSMFDEIMLIFKGGNNPLVGYLADDGATGGDWDSPFTDPPFDLTGDTELQDVSHISFYGRGSVNVPEPSLLMLLVLGLGSVVIGRRRAR